MENNKENTKEEGMSTEKKVLIGAGIAVLAAAAAGAIFFYGTESGKKKRREIKTWMLKMKADVLDEMEKMRDWSQSAYNSVVDTVAQRYEQLKNIDPVQIAALARDLKGYWNAIQRHLEEGQRQPRTTTRTRRTRTTKKKTE